jgi:hypothetical protein
VWAFRIKTHGPRARERRSLLFFDSLFCAQTTVKKSREASVARMNNLHRGLSSYRSAFFDCGARASPEHHLLSAFNWAPCLIQIAKQSREFQSRPAFAAVNWKIDLNCDALYCSIWSHAGTCFHTGLLKIQI